MYEGKQSNENKFKIDVITLKLKILSLGNNKAVGITGLSNEMLKHAISNENNNDHLINSLSILFNAIINHKYSPMFFNISIIKPLIKDTSKPTDTTNNLRAIAVSDALSNLFESVLETYIKSIVRTDDKQFGFKANSSCSHAILILKQTMHIAKYQRKRLYIAAIDAAKAFDKVNRTILWIRMLEIGVPPLIVLAIIKYYENSMMLVQLEDDLSRPFQITVRVRQGGVLSPLLFAIYINNLLISLQKLELGFRVGKTNVDVLAYADDILLLTTTKLNLETMLNKLSVLGGELEIKFNAEKSM